MMSWFRLRKQRQFTLDILKETFKAYSANHGGNEIGLSVYGCRCCHYCNEDTRSIHHVINEYSPAGEHFQFRSSPVAFVCLRCQLVSRHADGSGNEVHVTKWRPREPS